MVIFVYARNIFKGYLTSMLGFDLEFKTVCLGLVSESLGLVSFVLGL